jgi:hypothetical protein
MSSGPPNATAAAALMPQLKEDLARLVAIPSVSEWGFPANTRAALLEAHQVVLDLLRSAGVETFGSLELEGTAPVITGEIPGPEGAPAAARALRGGRGCPRSGGLVLLTPVHGPDRVD